MMNQDWFEMTDVRRRKLNDAVWIPLRASEERAVGEFGYVGYKAEFVGLGSLAVPIKRRTKAESLGWMDIGLRLDHVGGFQRRRYIPADVYENTRVGKAIPLVLAQRGNSDEPCVWHLHQDFVVTLALKREGDTWLAQDEGYIEVARLRNSSEGRPVCLEVRAEHLKDYLCARGMALYISSYRSRQEVVENLSDVLWPENPFCRREGHDRWEGRVNEIREGGDLFGSEWKVFQVTRANFDTSEDVPKISPFDENIVSKSWTRQSKGRKVYRVQGELWRTEWVEPAKQSPRIRSDKIAPSAFFITNASGKKEGWKTLRGGGQWLWFRPDVMMPLINRRGGALGWYTRDTGRVRCAPDHWVVFGVNKLGLVNVYAKDIAFLPDWQQQLWAGFNVSPEAGVSEELLASQAEGVPSNTQAPEEFLPKGIELLNKIARERFGFALFREHEHSSKLLIAAHRFRSVNKDGLLALAKDLARLIVDAIDTASLQKIIPSPKGEKWGSLKTVENVLAQDVSAAAAHSLLTPLHGIYNLRHGDVHLPSGELDEAFKLVYVDQTQPYVLQGRQLLGVCVSALYRIAKTLDMPASPAAAPKVEAQ